MKRNEGFVLITSLLIMVVVVVLVFGTSFTALVDRMISSNQRGANAAYYVAQAGLQQYKTLIFKNLVDYYIVHREGWCASPIAEGIWTWVEDEDGKRKHFVVEPGQTTPPEAFGPGEYRVNLQVSDTFTVLTSIGEVGNSQTVLQLVATDGAGPAAVYENAIFAAGRSPGTKAITGNIAVYGSIHIVTGSVELEDDEVEGDLDFSGRAGVYNNYIGDAGNSDIQDEVTAITGKNYEDLCARLKVDRGDVFLQGNAHLGAYGTPIHSVHLGTGKVYDGNEAREEDEITAHDDSKKVWLKYPADGQGVNSGYDGYELELPKLDSNYPNDIHDALDLEALDSDPNCQWLFQNDKVTLPPENPTADSPVCSDLTGSSSIRWFGGEPGHFKIEGDVNTGAYSVEIGESQTGTVLYEGKGVIRSGKHRNDSSVTTVLNGSVKPIEDDIEQNRGYPDRNALALISTGDKEIRSTASASEIAAIMYSAGSLEISGQPIIVGSLVAKDFNMGAGQNVPKVAWHPGIRDVAETLCLPGSFCDMGEVPPNQGRFTNISIERRDAAAID